MQLFEGQLKALERLENGKVLHGGVGSGKSITALAYYYILNGGKHSFLNGGRYVRMKNPTDLVIITTAKKRNDGEWIKELLPFEVLPEPYDNTYKNKVYIDSWNNIKKYTDIKGAFFIFDEQRLVGSGAWVRSFYKIAKNNRWILLSATPGDKWEDYIPLFVANGYYRNKTDFEREHAVWSRYTSWPKVDRWIGTERLEFYREEILIDMNVKRHTVRHKEEFVVGYDILEYRRAMKERCLPDGEPFINASGLTHYLRRLCSGSEEREIELLVLAEEHKRLIVFYNYDSELERLKNLNYGKDVVVAEYNGHKHDPVPDSDRWIYLVNYMSGSEGWNCITTNCTVFYSMNHSYKMTEQAMGRIDRINTPYTDLYYYVLRSNSPVERAIAKALSQKKDFNERKFLKWT